LAPNSNLSLVQNTIEELDLGFWEILKPLKWTKYYKLFPDEDKWLKKSTKIFISL
jgi:hypothetical protein